MGKVISIINLKGGVGKTTLAVCLGEFLGVTFRKRTLLIDMDHQTNLTYAMVPPKTANACASGRKTIFNMFESALSGNQWSLRDSIVKECSNIDGISSLHLAVSLPDVGHLDEMILAAYETKNRFASDARCILRDHIREEGLMEEYDYILIDCPPSLGLPTINALLVSDYFLVPVVPEFLSLQGLDLIMKRVGELKNRYDAHIDFAGTVLNKVSIQRTDHKEWSEVLFLSPEEKEKCTRELGDFIKRAQTRDNLAGLDIKKVRFGLILRDLRNNADFRPFSSWLGDLKPFYLVTDYGYIGRKSQKRKYPSIERKYNGVGANPDPEKWPNLGRGEKHYDLFGRCKGLTEEVMKRCQ